MKFVAGLLGNIFIYIGYLVARVGEKFCSFGFIIHKTAKTKTGMVIQEYEKQLDSLVKDIEFQSKRKERQIEDLFKSDRGGNA